MTLAARERRRLLDAITFAVVVATGVVSRRPVRPIRDEERRPAALGRAAGMPLGVYGESLPTAALIAGLVAAAIVLLGAVGAAQWLVLRRWGWASWSLRSQGWRSSDCDVQS